MKQVLLVSLSLPLLISFNAHTQSRETNSGSANRNDESIGSVSWSNGGNVYTSNDSRAEVTLDRNEESNYLVITGFSFSLPNAIIDGIEVEIERSKSSGGIQDNAVYLYSTGSIVGTDHAAPDGWPGSDEYATYGNSTDTWGAGLTYSDINNSGFGIAISATNVSADARTAYIDHVQITVYYSSALPITLTSFEAHLDAQTVSIEWVTASEENNDFFTIERSINGLSFSDIGRKKGAGNSSSVKNYKFIDDSPVKGVSYYRIRQTDFDGKFDYSDMTAVSFQKNSDGSCVLKIFPNPCPGKCYVTLSDCKENEDSEIIIEIVDALGNKIFQRIPYRNSNGSFTFHMDDSNLLAPGIYIVKAVSGKENYNKKIIVK